MVANYRPLPVPLQNEDPVTCAPTPWWWPRVLRVLRRSSRCVASTAWRYSGRCSAVGGAASDWGIPARGSRPRAMSHHPWGKPGPARLSVCTTIGWWTPRCSTFSSMRRFCCWNYKLITGSRTLTLFRTHISSFIENIFNDSHRAEDLNRFLEKSSQETETITGLFVVSTLNSFRFQINRILYSNI